MDWGADVDNGTCVSCCQFLGLNWLVLREQRGFIRVRTGWLPARARAGVLFGGQFKRGSGAELIYGEALVHFVSLFCTRPPSLQV